jgi:signal transduction histidine kinase
LYLLVMMLAGAAGGVICGLLGGAAAGLCAAGTVLVLLLVSVFFTRRRYREIARLSEILGRIAAGDYSPDLREYREGELSVLYDELHKVTRALSHQADALSRDKRWLADTMADISHQLRTPLTSVSMMTDLLAEPDLPEDRRAEFLDGIRSGAERIRWLVLSMLKLSRLDADAVVLQLVRVPVAELIERALGAYRIPMELKEQDLILELDDFAVACDIGWLAEAVGNLIHNCVEHTPRGGRIGVRATANPLYHLIEVWDDGPGISEEDLPHLFERFYRGKTAAPDSVGIGLALAKSIITRHGGAMEAMNADGAVFRVKLYKN